ncbi:S8 family serine peptidase [Rhodoferax aquaticus]|uniref:Peptidase S8 n=1 Tax=Rhodoferax aquaticus TaxID=2527691 RepID=A0A515ELJ8_9BURK|nr:S8 family serine peptidase [Rhodoferax aquaticus]QDL53499.1 peptidase S8 [Rhodoferax aquaticus]
MRAPLTWPQWNPLLAALGLAVLALTPCNLLADPQQDQVTAPLAQVPQREERLRRLIVKYKDESDGRLRRRALPDEAERATRLSALAQEPGNGHRNVQLSHLKAINRNSHVLVSSTALSRHELRALAHTLAQDAAVEYAEIDEPVYPTFLPNDSSYVSRQWNLKSPAAELAGTNMPNAWGRSHNGTGVTVAVLDTGYRPHAELNTNLVPGYDFVSGDLSGSPFFTANDGDGRDTDPADPGDWNTNPTQCTTGNSSWHGTRVAGIIGAQGNNNAGIIGVSHAARLLAVRVMGVCGGYTSDIAAGILWAIGVNDGSLPVNSHPAKVLNLSLGNRESNCSVTFQNAITAAFNANVTVVVAAGNEASYMGAPANCTGVIAVSAHTRTGDLADYSNLGPISGAGPNPTLSAPGGGLGLTIAGDNSTIYSTSNTGTTVPGSETYIGGKGTSFAAPQVAGVAAMMYQIKPSITPTEVKTYLTNTARAYPSGTYCFGRTTCGAGMLDGFKALQALMLAQGTPNNAPSISPIGPKTVAATGSLNFTATATDIDGDEVSFTATGVPSGASFNAVTGVFSWGYALPGNYTVSIAPTDGATAGSASVVNISVTGSLPVAAAASGGGGASNGAELALLFVFSLCAVGLRRHSAAALH